MKFIYKCMYSKTWNCVLKENEDSNFFKVDAKRIDTPRFKVQFAIEHNIFRDELTIRYGYNTFAGTSSAESFFRAIHYMKGVTWKSNL